MKNFTLDVDAGGIFSKFMFAIQNIQYINSDFDSVYINNIDNRSLIFPNNIFDKILDQNKDEDTQIFTAVHLENYSIHNPIEKSNKLLDYKKIIKKIKIKDSILSEVNKYINEFDLNDKFIGLHIRLCDMNDTHGNDYGVLSFNDFYKELQKHINEDSKIFVSSDNFESIKKLKERLGNKIFYINNFKRGENELQDTLDLQLQYFKDVRFWEEAFIEMLLLSKCGKLICRTSNLNNTSVIYSETIREIIRL